MAVSVKTELTFKPGKPERLFGGTYVTSARGDIPPWDISPDGKRFLMLKPPATASGGVAAPGPQKINVVLNWTEELKQRVPTK